MWPAAVSAPRLLLFALALAVPQPAHAHGGGPETRAIAVRPGHGQDLFVSATFGMLVSRDAGASWGWVCQQALGSGGFVPRSALWTAGGRLLAVTGPSLLVSADAGCSWERHPALEGPERGALDAVVPQAEPGTVYVLSADGVRRSADEARTFPRHAPAPEGLALGSLAVAPGAPERLYAAGVRGGAPALWRSRDGAQSGEVLAPAFLSAAGAALEGVGDLRLLAVSPADPEQVYARGVRGPEELLLRSTDGGASFRVQLTLGEPIEGLELSPDGRTVWLGSYSFLYRSRDGGLSFAQLQEPIVNACARLAGGGLLLGCGSEPDHGWSLGTSTDGGDSWRPLFRLAQLQQVAQCPASSPTAQQCTPLLPGLLNALRPVDGVPAAPPPAARGSGEGCASGGPAPALLPLLALAGLRARRRRGAH